MSSINNAVVEFLGTFIFLYVILESGRFDNAQPLVIAFGLLVAILMFGAVSGGHFNPAVTLMMYAKGDTAVSQPSEAFGYIVAQILGGLVAYKAHTILNKK